MSLLRARSETFGDADADAADDDESFIFFHISIVVRDARQSGDAQARMDAHWRAFDAVRHETADRPPDDGQPRLRDRV